MKRPETLCARQVVDTVELFHFKRQRKLSLRFLASYLLGVGIQETTHDSIVDARTALQLFQVAPASRRPISVVAAGLFFILGQPFLRTLPCSG
jgi:hypothetical protein